ncbi:MAG: hypothetical protein LPK45_05950 [Bacteroidota bacterium]|nr:hypothetical protein [Bacteroidota bacterium]MDX5430610.1 hypothetical protein [Bacteroidota bacterium]MDX5469362.1 hypothetical protein [Bacteroidota bacterium]
MKGPSLDFGSFQVEEFTGTLTDIVIAVIAFYAYYRIKIASGEKGTRELLSWHFLLLGMGTLLGGILGHGFGTFLGSMGKLPGWLLSIVSVFMLELTLIRLSGSFFSPKAYRLLYSLSLSIGLACFLLTAWSQRFFWVGMHTAYGLLFVVGLLGFKLWMKNYFRRAVRHFWIAIACSACAAAVFGLKISPLLWFNHLDLSHVFFMGSTWFFMLGGLSLLKETES